MNLVRTNFDDKDIAAEILDLFKDYEMKLTIFEEECPVREQIIERIFKSFDHAYFRYQKLDSNMEGEVLHDLRKKMKILWYQMDFIKFLNPKYLIVKTEQVHKLTEYLGDDHDLHVFLKEFFSNSYGLGEKEIEIIGNQVNHLREINSLKLIPGLKQFFGGSSETFKQKLKAIFNVYSR